MDSSVSRHHILPKSRDRKNFSKRNIALVSKTLHDRYHSLFRNKTPDEIINFLVNKFWNGQWEWIELALQKYRH